MSTTNAVEKTPELDRVNVQSIQEWFNGIATTGPVKIRVTRLAPKNWRGKNVGGTVGTLEELIEDVEEYIRDRWGGGKFQLQASMMQKGKWVYGATRQVEIAGDPKITGELFDDSAEPVAVGHSDDGGHVSLQRHALEMSANFARDERKRAERLETELHNRSQFDPTMLAALTKPFEAQMQLLQAQLAQVQSQLVAKDDRITQLITQKPDTSMQDRILEKMVDGESARIDAIRTQHASELRQLRESQTMEAQRLREHFIEEARSKDKAHDREIDNMRAATSSQIDSLKLAYDSRIDTLKGQLSAVERELNATKTELGEVRAKKEEPLESQITRILQLKEAFGSLGGAPAEDEGSTWERIMTQVMESPLAQGIATRIAEGPPSGVMPPSVAPPAAPVQAPPRAPAPPAQAGAVVPVRPAAPPRPAISRKELALAIQFTEQAVRNNTDPTAFAASARSLVPPPIVAAIKEQGVDAFLASSGVDGTSPLASQAGRNFLRKVIKALDGDSATDA